MLFFNGFGSLESYQLACKLASVFPVFKKADFGDYRPLPDKIMEKVIL